MGGGGTGAGGVGEEFVGGASSLEVVGLTRALVSGSLTRVLVS